MQFAFLRFVGNCEEEKRVNKGFFAIAEEMRSEFITSSLLAMDQRFKWRAGMKFVDCRLKYNVN
jgi:hypothetical protein